MGLKTNMAVLLFLAGGVSACGGSGVYKSVTPDSDVGHVSNRTKFSQAAYGVAASPRVTTARLVRKGGGRRQIGKPYKIRGKWYRPREDFNYDKTGQASWYGPNFHGRLTANGEVYDQYAITAAHPTFPLPSYARVTNVANGRSLIVRVNDRGPYHRGRIIDLSAKASEMLGYQHRGVAKVRVQYIKQAPLHGQDYQMLASSFKGGRSDETSAIKVATRAARPDSRRRVIKLSELTTGSVDTQPTTQDPFLLELEAIDAQLDTGTTLSLRLQKFLKSNEATKSVRRN
ncbi:MAG: septal ring lytic transglycosylase RlpA family protein [Rhizobiaceae bacterium]